MKTVLDMSGKPCPMPVVAAKKALTQADCTEVEMLVDNLVAVQNLQKMADGLGYGFAYTQEDALFTVTLQKTAGASPAPAAVQPVAPIADTAPQGCGLVVLLGSDVMGRGSDELGRLLMKGFIFSLTELACPPKAVLLLNRGAFLSTEGVNTVADLKTLEARGTTVLTCGTCANYFDLTDKLAVGSITDMMGITTQLAEAASVIAP